MVAKREGEDWSVFDWSLDDKRVILSDLVSSNETYLWVRMDLDIAGPADLSRMRRWCWSFRNIRRSDSRDCIKAGIGGTPVVMGFWGYVEKTIDANLEGSGGAVRHYPISHYRNPSLLVVPSQWGLLSSTVYQGHQ